MASRFLLHFDTELTMVQTIFLLSLLCSSSLSFQMILPDRPTSAQLIQCPSLSNQYERMAGSLVQSLEPLKAVGDQKTENVDIISTLIDTLENDTNIQVWLKVPSIYTRNTLIISISLGCGAIFGTIHFVMDLNVIAKCMKMAIEEPSTTKWRFLNPENCSLLHGSYRYYLYVVNYNYVAFESRSKIFNEDEPAYFITFAVNQTQSLKNSCRPDEEQRLQKFFSKINECIVTQVEKRDTESIVIIAVGIILMIPVCAVCVTKIKLL